MCGQDVAELPAHDHPPDLKLAERHLADADKAVARAAEALATARPSRPGSTRSWPGSAGTWPQVEARLDGVAGPDLLDDQLAAVDEAEAVRDKARQAERDARKAMARR